VVPLTDDGGGGGGDSGSSSSSSSGTSAASTGAILGGVFGALGLVLAVYLGWRWLENKKNAEGAESQGSSSSSFISNIINSFSGSRSNSSGSGVGVSGKHVGSVDLSDDVELESDDNIKDPGGNGPDLGEGWRPQQGEGIELVPPAATSKTPFDLELLDGDSGSSSSSGGLTTTRFNEKNIVEATPAAAVASPFSESVAAAGVHTPQRDHNREDGPPRPAPPSSSPFSAPPLAPVSPISPPREEATFASISAVGDNTTTSDGCDSTGNPFDVLVAPGDISGNPFDVIVATDDSTGYLFQPPTDNRASSEDCVGRHGGGSCEGWDSQGGSADNDGGDLWSSVLGSQDVFSPAADELASSSSSSSSSPMMSSPIAGPAATAGGFERSPLSLAMLGGQLREASMDRPEQIHRDLLNGDKADLGSGGPLLFQEDQAASAIREDDELLTAVAIREVGELSSTTSSPIINDATATTTEALALKTDPQVLADQDNNFATGRDDGGGDRDHRGPGSEAFGYLVAEKPLEEAQAFAAIMENAQHSGDISGTGGAEESSEGGDEEQEHPEGPPPEMCSSTSKSYEASI
jgi:hypothetical protein